MLLQLAFVLIAIIIGARIGGIGLGVLGGLGLGILTDIQAQWVKSLSNRYYVDDDKKMVTGYQTINGAKYYFASSVSD